MHRSTIAAVIIGVASVTTLSACGGSSTAASGSSLESSTAPSMSAASSQGDLVDSCSLISADDLETILGQAPGATTNLDSGACGYADLGLAFTVATAAGFDSMTSNVEKTLTDAGGVTTATPVTGAGDQAVAYDLGAGNTNLVAKNESWAVNVAGPAPVDQLAAIGTEILAALDARS